MSSAGRGTEGGSGLRRRTAVPAVICKKIK